MYNFFLSVSTLPSPIALVHAFPRFWQRRMLRLAACTLRASRGRAAAAVAASFVRCSGSAAEPPKDASSAAPTHEPPTAPQEEPKKAQQPELGPDDVLQAVKSGDINRMQDTAARLVQSKWKEEYTLPAACVVVFIILWYWVAWTRRSVRRKCAAAEAAVRQEAQETVEMVRSLTEKWRKDLNKSNERMKAVIEKNSDLTGAVDRMTTALRSCSIRPTPNLSTSMAKVKVVAESPKAAGSAESPVHPTTTATPATEASLESLGGASSSGAEGAARKSES